MGLVYLVKCAQSGPGMLLTLYQLRARVLYDLASQLTMVSSRVGAAEWAEHPCSPLLTLGNGQEAACSGLLRFQSKLQELQGDNNLPCHGLP